MTLQAAGASASATIGTAWNVGTGLAGTAMVAGASSETSGRGLTATYTTTTQHENTVEKLVPGTAPSVASSLGNQVEGAITDAIKKQAEKKPFEANPEISKQIADNQMATKTTKLYQDKIKKR